MNADGDVYACFMLMEQRSYSYGSVLAQRASKSVASSSHGSRREHIENLLQQQDKYTNAACRVCWAQPLCHGCLGEDFARSDGLGVVRSAISGEFCVLLTTSGALLRVSCGQSACTTMNAVRAQTS